MLFLLGCGGGAQLAGDGAEAAEAGADVGPDGQAEDAAAPDAEAAEEADGAEAAESTVDAAEGDSSPPPDAVSCDELRARFRSELAAAQACDEDEDCVAAAFPVPGLSYCYTGVDRAADLGAVEDAAAELRSAGCETRDYPCGPEPPSVAVCSPVGTCRLMGEEYPFCDAYRAAFDDELERLARCTRDEDCTLVVVRNCGVRNACWVAIHRDADQTLLRDIEHEYGVVLCPYATCSCPLPASVICDGGRCVDLYD